MMFKKTILITGGTGSIGTELVKYLSKSVYVKKLIVYFGLTQHQASIESLLLVLY